jgi:hypothetical protein
MNALTIATPADVDAIARSLSVDDIIERELAAGVRFGPYHRRWLTNRAPERARRLLEQAALDPSLVGTRQGFGSADYNDFPPANLRAAINTTTTETNLWDPAIWGPLPVGEIRGGKIWQVEFGGVMGTTSTPAISFRARIGTNNSAPPTGADLGVGPTVTIGTFTAQPFYGEFQFGCRSVGVAAGGATFTGNGFVMMPAAAAATATPHAMIGGAIPTTVDNTIAQGIAVSVIWGTANAANTITPQWVLVRSLN